MKAAVTLSDVSVSFFKHTVLHKINAAFPANRVSVLVGRSGSGKTTLLRTINRLNEEFPGCKTTGKVCIDFGAGPVDIYGEPESGGGKLTLPELRLRVGMLFQTPNCFPVSAYRNIAMPLALVAGAPSKEIPDLVRASLESVGLWAEIKDRLHTPADRLSGGQQQRLCLARLLALRPAVLLLDEPTASLDVHASDEIEKLLRNLASQYTIIMVSYGLPQARRMADQALVCDAGKIVAAINDQDLLTEDALSELMRS